MYVLMNRPSGKSLALSIASIQPLNIYQLDSVQFLEAKSLFLPSSLKIYQSDLLFTCLP
jgi:hypothetical protein